MADEKQPISGGEGGPERVDDLMLNPAFEYQPWGGLIGNRALNNEPGLADVHGARVGDAIDAGVFDDRLAVAESDVDPIAPSGDDALPGIEPDAGR